MANKKKGRIITGTVIVGTLLALYLLTRRAKAAALRYSCSGSPNYTCSEDINGAYGTMAECQGVCASAPSQIIDVIVTEP